jgi:hypothetical protein
MNAVIVMEPAYTENRRDCQARGLPMERRAA